MFYIVASTMIVVLKSTLVSVSLLIDNILIAMAVILCCLLLIVFSSSNVSLSMCETLTIKLIRSKKGWIAIFLITRAYG